MPKERVDALLVARKLAPDLDMARRLVMAGQVRAAGQVVAKSSDSFDDEIELSVDQGPRFVSRGGDKLQGALEAFAIDPAGLVCADVGASTGGFTDCLLQHGAKRVYAIDVGKGQLDWRLRQDQRVVVMEETNARLLESLPEPVSLATVDASFISLKSLLPVIMGWLPEGGEVVALVKPQFEATQAEADRGQGVISDPAIHRRILEDVLAFAGQSGYRVAGLIRSPLTGPKGNVEFLLRLEKSGLDQPNDNHVLIAPVIDDQSEDADGPAA